MLQKLQSFRLFQRSTNCETRRQVILWWEARRIPFNIIVGITGIITCALLALMGYFAETKFGLEALLPDPPIVAVLAIFLYGIGANVCYTGGWLSELFVRREWKEKGQRYGEIAFMLGVLFSVALTLLPVAASFAIYSFEILTASK
jgi:hypothetical protein